MGRMTHRYTDGEAWTSISNVCACGENECKGPAIERLAAYEETGLEPGELPKIASRLDRLEQTAHDALGQVLQAQREERLVILPCQIGAPVWWITLSWVERTVTVRRTIESGKFRYAMLDWQNPVYTSLADAEAALAEMAKGKEDSHDLV